MKRNLRLLFTFALTCGWALPSAAQVPQSPSPMVEHIREHPRLEKQSLPGERIPLSVGTLTILPAVRESTTTDKIPLLIAFHCGDWIPEVAVSRLPNPPPCLTIQLGAGSSRYSKPFADDEKLLDRLVEEASQHLKRPIADIILVGWSAGYGAIGQILSQEGAEAQVSAVLLIDGLHTGYEDGKPGPKESTLQTKSLDPYLKYARQAAEGSRRMMIVHSEIFPGTYASTTETADWLLQQLNLRRKAVLRWGPMKTQILGETAAGHLVVRAFAGNSAPDHIDLLHALPELLEELIGL
jgi:hypothetical protein